MRLDERSRLVVFIRAADVHTGETTIISKWYDRTFIEKIIKPLVIIRSNTIISHSNDVEVDITVNVCDHEWAYNQTRSSHIQMMLKLTSQKMWYDHQWSYKFFENLGGSLSVNIIRSKGNGGSNEQNHISRRVWVRFLAKSTWSVHFAKKIEASTKFSKGDHEGGPCRAMIVIMIVSDYTITNDHNIAIPTS
jgi:hypothetical protein